MSMIDSKVWRPCYGNFNIYNIVDLQLRMLAGDVVKQSYPAQEPFQSVWDFVTRKCGSHDIVLIQVRFGNTVTENFVPSPLLEKLPYTRSVAMGNLSF